MLGGRQVKTIYCDIETSPLLVYTWGTFDQTVAINQIVKDWTVLGMGWAEDGKPVEYADCRDRRDPRDDKRLMKTIHRVLDEADVVVAHNGASFDVRKINARLAHHGMSPPSPYKVVDTKRIAKRSFWFTSNRLEWLAPLAGSAKSKHGKFPGFELWAEVMKGNQEAWAEMETYCRQDVEALRALHVRLQGWDKTAPNRGLQSPGAQVCPKCGSARVHKRGQMTTAGGIYSRFQCQDCGGWSRGAKVPGKAVLKGE